MGYPDDLAVCRRLSLHPKLAKENDELREINDVLHVKIASYEQHKPVEQQERPEWVRYLMDGTDPRMEGVK